MKSTAFRNEDRNVRALASPVRSGQRFFFVTQWVMRDVNFSLSVSLLKKAGAPPRGIHVDGISILGKPYRAEVKLSGPPPAFSDHEIETLRNVVREILGILMRADFDTHQVNKMKFRVAL